MSGRYRRPPNSSLFVRNLSYSVKTEELRSIFTKHGPITDVYLPLDYYTHKPRGFAYVQYEDVIDAEEALKRLDGYHLHGNPLEIQYAEGDRKTPGQMRVRERGGDSYYGGGSRDHYSRRYREDDRYSSRYGRERDYDRDRYSRGGRRDREYYTRKSYSRSYSRSPSRRMGRGRMQRPSRSRSRSYSRSYSRSRSNSRSLSPHSKRRSDK